MYKKEFGYSGEYEMKKKEIEDKIQFFDTPEPLYDYFETIKNNTLELLVSEYTGVETSLKEDDLDLDQKQLAKNQMEICGELIAYKLGLGFNFGYLIDNINENFQHIEKAFKSIEELKNHRHKVGEGHYSEKPAW